MVFQAKIGSKYTLSTACALMFLLVIPSAFANQISPVLEITLKKHQEDTLADDKPYSGVFLDQDSALWISGKNFIWRWVLSSGRLQKIQISSLRKDEKIAQMASDQSRMFISTTSGRLLTINFNPLRINWIDHTTNHHFRLIQGIDKTEISWLKTNTLYTYKNSSLQEKYQFFPEDQQKLLQAKFIFLDSAMDRFWLTNRNGFETWTLKEKQISAKDHNFENKQSWDIYKRLLLRPKDKIKGLVADQSGVSLYTEKTVLHFDPYQNYQKPTPVESARRLLRMDRNIENHGYLFSDRLLQIFRLNLQEKRFYRLNTGLVKKIDAFQYNRSIVAFIGDGQPRVFRLGGLWTQSKNKSKIDTGTISPN